MELIKKTGIALCAAALLAVAAAPLQYAEAAGTLVQSKGFGLSAAGNSVDTTDNPVVDGGAGTTWNTPTSGNRLVLGQCVDKNVTTAWTAVSGWTVINDDISTSVSIRVITKISDGTESTITAAWTGTARLSQMWIGEYSGLDTFDVAAENPTDEVSTTSWASGTTATTAEADARAFAIFCSDSGSNVEGGTVSYTNSNSFVDIFGTTGDAGGSPGINVAELDLASTGTQTTTINTTAGGDQISGSIAVFDDSGGGGGSSVAPILYNQRQQMGQN